MTNKPALYQAFNARHFNKLASVWKWVGILQTTWARILRVKVEKPMGTHVKAEHTVSSQLPEMLVMRWAGDSRQLPC